MSRQLTDVLAEALAALDDGAALEDVLARYPEHRKALRPLVEAARAVDALPPQPVRADFRTQLGAEIDALEAARMARPDGGRPLAERSLTLIAVGLVLLGLLGALVVTRGPDLGPDLSPSAGRLDRGVSRSAADDPAAQWADPATRSAADAATGRTGRPRDGTADRPGAAPTTVDRHLAATLHRTPSPTATGPRPTTTSTATRGPMVARGPEIVTATPLTPPPAVVPTRASDTRAPTAPPPSPTDRPTAVPPSPTVSPAPSPSTPGQAVISGQVQQLTADDTRPLVDVTVTVYRDDGFDCTADPPAPIFRQTTTDAAGAYRIYGLPAGWYRVSASGGPQCLPMRWYIGSTDLGTADPCATGGTEIGAETPVRTWNIFYEPDVVGRCP